MKIVSLYASNKSDVAKQLLAKEAAEYGLPNDVSVDAVIDLVLGAVGGLRAKRVQASLAQLWDDAHKKSQEESEKAWKYLEEEHFAQLISSFAEQFSSFAKHHRDFLPIILHGRLLGALPNDATVSSLNFDDTKMLYGNFFEVLTAAFVVPALMNNVVNGRAYEAFGRLSLKEYLNLDKSGRHNCFSSQQSLNLLSEFLDNQLRNASHHQSISINLETGRIAFRAGKSSIRRFMSYAEYLSKMFSILEVLVGLIMFVSRRRAATSLSPLT